ncbi:MAG: hypothetical protein JXB24_05330 [Bacteroidales bacterium]|nr:hypothetical protein [Bacteroidales bacterium]
MKELTIVISCTWKFALTFPVAVCLMRMSFAETILYTNIGGILGVFVFSFLSRFLIDLWEKYLPEKYKIRRTTRKKFSVKNRRLVWIKQKYGMPGIVVLTPVLLSVPVGAFLVTKYYGKKLINYFWLFFGLFCWSLIYTAFYFQMMDLF